MAILPGPDEVGPISDNLPRRSGIGTWNPDVIGRATGAEASSLEHLGGEIGTVGAEFGQSADQIQYAQAQGAAHAALAEAHAALPAVTDPSQLIPKNADTPAPTYADVGTKIANARSMISNPRMQAQFDASMQPAIATYGAASLTRGRELNNQNGLASLQQNTDTIINNAASLDDETAAAHALDSIKSQVGPLVASGAMNPVQASTFQKQAVTQFAEARFKYLQGQAEQTRDYTKLNAFIGNMMSGFTGSSGAVTPGSAPAAPGAAPPIGGTGSGVVTQGNGSALSPAGGPWVKGPDGKTYATNADGEIDTKVQPITAAPPSAAAPTTAADGSPLPPPRPSAAGQVAGPGAPSTASSPQGLEEYKKTIAKIESDSGRNQGVLGSYYQFEPSTWAKYGSGGTKGTAAGEDAAINRLTADNQASLTSSLGRAPTPAELYLAHQQGAGGAAKLIANPTVPAGQLVPPANIRSNGGDPAAPAAEFVALWNKKYAQASGSPATPMTPVSAYANAMPAPGAPSVAAAAAYKAGLVAGVSVNDNGGTQVASLGTAGLPGSQPIGLPVAPQVPGLNIPVDPSASSASRAPPESQWPEGAQSVVTNQDGTVSYQMTDGTTRPVPGSRATGSPHPQFPAPAPGSIMSLLPPETRANIQLQGIREIMRMQRQDAADNQKDNRNDIAAITNAQKQMETGLPFGETAWAPIRNAYSNSPDPQVRYNFAVADAVRNNLLRYQNASPSDVAADIGNLQAEYARQINSPNGAITGGVLGQVIKSSQAYLKNYEQGVNKDPLGRAAMEGVIGGDVPLKSLDPTSSSFGQDVADRVNQAQVAQKMFGLSAPVYLRPEERAALRKVAAAGGDTMVNLAKGIVQGAGSNAADVFKQIGKEAPPLAQIGEWAMDPHADHTDQIKRYADYIQALSDPAAAKNLPHVDEQTMRSSRVDDPLQDAASEFPTDAVGRLRNTANILASESAYTLHLDPKNININPLPGDLIPNAYHDAVGGTTDLKSGQAYGGIAPVTGAWFSGRASGYNAIVPTNMARDKFNEALGQINESDIQKMGPPPVSVGANAGILTAEDIKKGKFVAVPDKATGLFTGKYRVQIPDPTRDNSYQPVLNQDGKPWIFDMNRAQQNGLDQRVPGAFMAPVVPPAALPRGLPRQSPFRDVKGPQFSPDVASADTSAAPTEE